MVRQAVPRLWTVEEYLAYEEETHLRYEYLDGNIYEREPACSDHSHITVNSTTEIGLQLRDSSCHPYGSGLRIQISKTKYVYPDFSVVCGEEKFADKNESMLTNPTLVAEVLSSSTAGYDKGDKSDLYRNLPSLQAYLLIDQSRVYVQLYTRHEAGWLLREFNQLDMTIPLEMIQCNLPLAEIYRDIDFDESTESDTE